MGWSNFFSSCAVVLHFWFWQEIGFGFTYYLCTQSTIQLWCCVTFLVLAVNSFLCYVCTQCTIQLCGCVNFWLWQEIILKMRTPFYKKKLIGLLYYDPLADVCIIRSELSNTAYLFLVLFRSTSLQSLLFLKNIENFLCVQNSFNARWKKNYQSF